MTFWGFEETEKSRSKNPWAWCIPGIFRATFFGFFETKKSHSKNHLKKVFSSNFFRFRRNRKKVARKIPGKWAIIGRLNPAFHGLVDLSLLYRSVKGRVKTEHFSPHHAQGFFERLFSVSSKPKKVTRKITFFKKLIFRATFFGFEETEKSCSKNPRKVGYNWPFEPALSRISRSQSPLSIRERAVQNGAF